ncbi:MAG: glutamate formimidoyltransferase [Bacteroidota bacterium]
MPTPLLECVPNFSEGRDLEVIEAITDSIRNVAGVQLLHIDIGAAANRTVMTFAGNPQAVLEAAFRAIQTAQQHIDMRAHQGEHPRIGATDVCPLVPISGMTLAEVVVLAQQLGKQVGDELDIPVFLYEAAATHPTRQNLATIRKGEYEGLADKLQDDDWQPDFGTVTSFAKSGATVIGARPFLLAYNINLATKDVHIAKAIAATIRESGKVMVENRARKRQPGLFQKVKAIGWYIKDFDRVQISMNLTDFRTTNLHEVYEACCRLAKEYETEVTGSELIGLVPLEAMLLTGQFYAPGEKDERNLVETAIERLHLREVDDFEAQKRVIEYVYQS